MAQSKSEADRRKSKHRPAKGNATREDLLSTTVQALRSHWRDIRRQIQKGIKSHAETRCGCFEADTEERREALARRFYSLSHAERILARSDKAIASNISFYARVAIDQAWCEYEGDPIEQRRFMRSLVENEYVLMDGGDVASYPLPGYDDWYERSVGADMFYKGHIMKSTGEKFSEIEADWLDSAVRETTWQDPDLDFWHSETQRATANRIMVYIYPVTRSDYTSSIKESLWRGEKPQVVALLEELRCVASEQDEEPSVRKRIERLFVGIAKIEADDLCAKTWRFLASRHTPADYLIATNRVIETRWKIPCN